MDAVRAVAIGLVLASHCGDVFFGWFGRASPQALSVSGFFGVELFFVLSGFLIGRLLLRILLAGPTWQGWRVFMVRRWMRTLPAYLLWLAFLALFWPPRFWEPGHWTLIWPRLLRYATLTQNLAWPMPDGWFGVSWSLTVEEWFYLLFSSALFGAAAVLGRRAGFWAVCGLFLAVPAALRWGVPDSADFGEVLTKVAVLRLDAIAFGVIVAGMEAVGALPFRRPATALGLGLLLVAAVWTGALDLLLPSLHVRRTLAFDVASVGFALCLPASAMARRLAPVFDRIVEAVSRQSYAIYLTHLSILEFAGYYRDRWHLPVSLTVAGSLGLIWAVSWASWRWLEAPILARRPRQPTGPEPGRVVAHASGV